MKKFMLFSMCACLLAITGNAFGTLTVFDGGAGLAGWTYIGNGNGYDSGVLVAGGFKSLVTLTTPTVTNDYGVDGASWGWDAAIISPTTSHTIWPSPQAYVGARYQAPSGQVITGVTIPRMYFNVDPSMQIQIVDAAGVVKAQSASTAATQLILGLSATGMSTSAVEIRWVNLAPWEINLWGSGNGVILNTVEVTTAPVPEPATMALLALGSLYLSRRKK
jgi:hypothetical protein